MYSSSNAIYYPKRNTKELFTQLVTQCIDVGVTMLDKLPADINMQYDLLIDAIFGFSFSGDIKEPFKSLISMMGELKIPIASIDVPSGWDVDKGNVGKLFTPQMLISLTMPKTCAELYKGVHYLGGRFIPKSLFSKYGITPPFYEGSNEYIKL
jgi:NAD(P)H-hydrate epimerase